MLDRYDKESRAITEDALRMTWFMRGGVTYAEVMEMSHHEREVIGKIVKKNMETTKESGLPFF
jgi:hypothetical protein